jgi:hypothetical protein
MMTDLLIPVFLSNRKAASNYAIALHYMYYAKDYGHFRAIEQMNLFTSYLSKYSMIKGSSYANDFGFLARTGRLQECRQEGQRNMVPQPSPHHSSKTRFIAVDFRMEANACARSGI